MKTIAIIAARMGSTREPGKVMRQLGGMPMLAWVVRAAKAATGIDEVFVATTQEDRDNTIVHWCIVNGIDVWRGPEDDVLKRFYDCAKAANADVVVRLTGDCPFLDPAVISDVVLLRKHAVVDYASNVDPPTWPDGLDVECFTMAALSRAHHEATLPSDRDCLTQYITRNRHRFLCANLTCPIPNLQHERWVIDTKEDFSFAEQLIALGDLNVPSYRAILSRLEKNPKLRAINWQHRRNERFHKQRATEELPTRIFDTSKNLLTRSLKVQPYGASTYSKSVVAYGPDSPLYVTHGDGGICYDCEGNSYLDFVGALGTVILGHRNTAVDAAIRDQLDRGINFSLGTTLEIAVCERLAELPAGDNMVVLGKSGSDATTAALRIARAYTGAQHVIALPGSYHGWHDWSLGGTVRGYGIPYNAHFHVLIRDFGDVDITLGDFKIAAVIVEPDRYEAWQLRTLKAMCEKEDTLLIFDEVYTGMRYPDMLVSRYHHVHPDLTCLGKSIANGMPLSALVGSRKIMERFAPGPDDPNAFYSTTMGGECLSLAACKATLHQLYTGANEAIQRTAEYIDIVVREQTQHFGLSKKITSSNAPLNRLSFETAEMANQFRAEMAQQGVLIYSAFNCMAAHTEDDLTRLEAALYTTLKKIANGTARGYQPAPNTIMRR